MKSFIAANLLGILLFSSVLVAQDQESLVAQAALTKSLTSALSDKTGRVVFSTDNFSDGSSPTTFIGSDEGSEDLWFKSKGELTIESDRLNLSMEDLLFNTTTGKLDAKVDVRVETEGIEAWSDELSYETTTKGITLIYLDGAFTPGNTRNQKPGVFLDSPDKLLTFDKMGLFQVVPDETGRTITVNGKNEIIITMKEKAPDSTTSSISKLGSSLNITVSARDGQPASAVVKMLETGEVSTLHMIGSIRLLSTEFNIRADEMIYNAETNTFEAIGNVYVVQGAVKADCGQMVYDLLTGKIRLSSNPFVSYIKEMDKIELMDYDVINIEPSQGSVPNIVPEGRGKNIMTSRSLDEPQL